MDPLPRAVLDLYRGESTRMEAVKGLWHCYRVDLGGCRGIENKIKPTCRLFFFVSRHAQPNMLL
jgi:hypothetical protein